MASRGDRTSRPAKRLSLREQQKIFTSTRLEEAAVVAFVRHGYQDTTIEDICDEAGTSRATFYLHFRSKRDLARVIAERIRPELLAAYESIGELETASTEAVRTWLDRVMSAWEHHWNELTVAAQAVRTDPSVAPAYWSDHRHRIGSITERMVGWGASKRDAELRASLLIGSVERMCQIYLDRPDEFDRIALLEALTRLALSQLEVGLPGATAWRLPTT
jgi:AcrR family transcriptional regulator